MFLGVLKKKFGGGTLVELELVDLDSTSSWQASGGKSSYLDDYLARSCMSLDV